MKQQILDAINTWHKEQDYNGGITGEIDLYAKEKLAETLEMMFCQEKSSQAVADCNALKLGEENFALEKPESGKYRYCLDKPIAPTPKRRGRPARIQVDGKKRKLRSK